MQSRIEQSPNSDMIEFHRQWMEAAGQYTENTIRDSCELLYRVDADLITMQRAAGEPAGGLATAWPEELEAWLAHGRVRGGEKKWSRETISTYRKPLVRFFGWAESNGWITYNPAVGLVAPKINQPVPKPASNAQVAYIAKYAIDPIWMHCMLAAYAGFRPADIANARREHFTMEPDLVDGQLVEVATIRVHGKGDKPAILPCDPVIWEAVRHLPEGPIARRAAGRSVDGPVTPQTITNDACYYLHNKLHLDISLRNLRAWYATTMLEKYGDPRVVQELMRHSSLQTLQRYTAVVDARKRAALLTLPRFGERAATAVGGDAAAVPSSDPRARRVSEARRSRVPG
jgi:integrase